jgi:hypothetical protein
MRESLPYTSFLRNQESSKELKRVSNGGLLRVVSTLPELV